jgi:thiol-disulfide isomerase/thioredoxin
MLVSVMPHFFMLALSLLTFAAGEPEMPTLSFEGKAFVEAFNAASDRGRIVVVISPTCGHCLQLASQVNEVLQQYPEARLQVFVLWSPFMRTDNRMVALRAAGYLNDPRVQHFWDLWRFGSRIYTEQLKVPPMEAWDMLVFYKPHLQWRERPPEPTFWMQNRGLDVGQPYSKEALLSELKAWIEPTTAGR